MNRSCFANVCALMAVTLLSQLTLPALSANAQSRRQGSAVFKVSLKDRQGTDHLVQQFGLLVQKIEPESGAVVTSSVAVQTISDGTASLALPPGEYLIKSKQPLVINDMAYQWSVTFLGMSLGAMGGTLLLPPRDFKFSTNFNEMILNCDGKPVTPIQRGRIPYREYLQSYMKLKQRSAYVGIYTYSVDTFEPGKCKQLTLEMISDETPATSATKALEPVTAQRVWDDFAVYRQRSTAKP